MSGGRVDLLHFQLIVQQQDAVGTVAGNGIVDISDVTALINYVLSGSADGIVLDNADINGDQGINISDIVALINIVLGGAAE